MISPDEPKAGRRRLIDVRGWPNRVSVAGQVIAGVAVFVSIFVGMTWLLSGFARPPSQGPRLASAENWPEIKDGVPEVMAPARAPVRLIGHPGSEPIGKRDQPTLPSANEQAPGAAPIIRGFVPSTSAGGTAQR